MFVLIIIEQMKQLFFSAILLYSIIVPAQQTEELKMGYPLPIKGFFDGYGQFKPSEVKTGEVKTGIDSLQVYFGTAKNSKMEIYWAGITNNDSVIVVGGGFDLKEIKPNIFSSDFILPFGGNSSSKIKFYLEFNSKTNTIHYNWLDANNQKAHKLELIGPNKFEVDSKIENVSFLNLNGKEINLEAYKGKIVVLNWWNTRCAPCIKEMPGLNMLVKSYSKNNNIVFLAVAHNTVNEVTKFLKKREFNYLQFTNNEKSIEFF